MEPRTTPLRCRWRARWHGDYLVAQLISSLGRDTSCITAAGRRWLTRCSRDYGGDLLAFAHSHSVAASCDGRRLRVADEGMKGSPRRLCLGLGVTMLLGH